MVYDPPHERSPITTQNRQYRVWGIDLDPRREPRSLRSGPEARCPVATPVAGEFGSDPAGAWTPVEGGAPLKID